MNSVSGKDKAFPSLNERKIYHKWSTGILEEAVRIRTRTACNSNEGWLIDNDGTLYGRTYKYEYDAAPWLVIHR